MKGIFSKGNLSTAVLLSLQLFILAPSAQAEVTYHDVAGSITKAFSGDQLFTAKNLILSIITILFFALVFLVFYLSWLKKRKESSQSGGRIGLMPSDRHQRRNWYRLKTNMEFKWVAADETANHKDTGYKKDRLVDISGGGLCFKTTEKLKPGDWIKFIVNVGEGHILSADGRVLRSDKIPNQDIDTYRVSVEFGQIPSRERDKLISFIMKRQHSAIKGKRKKDSK